jgi:MtN3 and saliva related transmembrane protein
MAPDAVPPEVWGLRWGWARSSNLNLEAPIQQIAPYIGYVAGALTVLSFLPQVVRAWRTKQTKDLSLGMFAILIAAGVLWLTYGVLTSDWPVVVTNGGMVALNVAILVAKLRFK